MQKVVVHRPGGHDRLALETHPDPAPGPGDVVVETVAVGVNYADCIVRMGLYESAKKYVGWPITPGFEFAGRIIAIGLDAGDDPAQIQSHRPLRIGDAVFGVTRFGGYATHVRVPRRQLFPIPASFSVAQAASFPTVFLSAWYALCELIRLREGMHVLVHSAAGGVGGALVQIARAHGCRVVGVVGGAHKLEACRRHGAHAVIDKTSEELWSAVARHAPNGYDVVLDANGVETLRGSYAALMPTGKLVVYGFHSMLPRRGGRPSWPKLALDFLRMPRYSPLTLTNDNKSVLAFNLSYLFDRVDLLEAGMRGLLEWVAAGKLDPLPVEELPLADAADAHRRLESGRTVGKLVLRTATSE